MNAISPEGRFFAVTLGLLAFIATFNIAYAVEGTCSYHGGVNCGAGADFDGSAICKDGWEDSSELYYQQEICKQTPMCTYPKWLQLSSTPEMSANKTRLSVLISQMEQLNLEYPLIEIRLQQEAAGQGITTGGLAPQISAEKKKNRDAFNIAYAEALTLETTLHAAQRTINKTCSSIGQSEYEDALADIAAKYTPPPQPAAPKTATCPANSNRTSDSQCACISGYANYKNTCISVNDWCALSVGPSYSYNPLTKQCELPQQQATAPAVLAKPADVTTPAPKPAVTPVTSPPPSILITPKEESATSTPPVVYPTTSSIPSTTKRPSIMSRIVSWLSAFFK